MGVQISGEEGTSSASRSASISKRGARYILNQVSEVVVDVLVFEALLHRKRPEREKVLLTKLCKFCRKPLPEIFAFKLHKSYDTK